MNEFVDPTLVLPEQPLSIIGIDGYETFCIDKHTIGIRPKWISVSESLPEEYEYVLVCAKMKGTNEPSPISIARIEATTWNLLFENKACACGDLNWTIETKWITHWMPLPKFQICSITTHIADIAPIECPFKFPKDLLTRYKKE